MQIEPPEAPPATPPRSRPVSVVVTFLAVAVVTAVAAFVLVRPTDHGIASPLVLDGQPSGFWRLAVATEPGVPGIAAGPQVQPSGRPEPSTVDQALALTNGWVAACLAWSDLGVTSWDHAAACALGHGQRPQVSSPGATTGSSAELANALAFMDTMFDINGELAVAATGTLRTEVVPAGPGYASSPQVLTIAGADHKARAAAAAGVDVLVVPTANAAEVTATVGRRVTVLAVDSVADAVKGLCQLSATEFCLRHSLAGQ